jgi:hypothetical protein
MKSTTSATPTRDLTNPVPSFITSRPRPTLRHWTHGSGKPKLISLGWVPVTSTWTHR